jgi:hypothetical protein
MVWSHGDWRVERYWKVVLCGYITSAVLLICLCRQCCCACAVAFLLVALTSAYSVVCYCLWRCGLCGCEIVSLTLCCAVLT